MQHPRRPLADQPHEVPCDALSALASLSRQCLLEVGEVVDHDELQEAVQRRSVRKHLHEHRPFAQLKELSAEVQHRSVREGKPLPEA